MTDLVAEAAMEDASKIAHDALEGRALDERRSEIHAGWSPGPL